MRAIPERLRGVFTTRRYTNPCLPLPYLTLRYQYNNVAILVYSQRMVCIRSTTNADHQRCWLSNAARCNFPRSHTGLDNWLFTVRAGADHPQTSRPGRPTGG